jgi:hypothetical protein
LDDEKVPGASFIVNGAAPAKDEIGEVINTAQTPTSRASRAG